ncbi:MAG: aconitate hydratase AcnA, partial [Verrucomicrobiales bacterium]|nr:aconitate hydratase AcnA [Verrucomicrobiales bacterium]
PVYFLTPDVVGVQLTGVLSEGVTATDLALTVTEMLRAAKVVGKFVEFYGPGAEKLPLTDRATIANMAPEYGATMGYFPIDEETVNYLRATGRTDEHCTAYENYYRAQGLFGIPKAGEVDYTTDLALDLGTVTSSVAGPKRPQDRIELPRMKEAFSEMYTRPVADGGFGREAGTLEAADSTVSLKGNGETELGHGTVVIAAITSCTNTSNPGVMLAAALLAKKAVERGLTINPIVKTSLGPGSRVVTDYLEATDLQQYFDTLGFHLVGYGCTTCIGNSGPLAAPIEAAIVENDLITASVLSGNRNFEARIHQNIKANFLMSPPLVVAFALAGRVDINLSTDALGTDTDGNDVFLHDLWPSLEEVNEVMQAALKPEIFRKLYSDFANQNPKWNEIPANTGDLYEWDADSTYIQEPPFFEDFSLEPGNITPIEGACVLGLFGDSVTTDHISPAGAIKADSPAGKFLQENGVEKNDFNSFGSRRGNDRIMTRGTFGNVRIKNQMVPGTEGGITTFDGETVSIHEAAMAHRANGTPLIVLAGTEYGTGSSRDWAAKGTLLLGVRAVVAASFERIHRSNLVGMGVLPLQFKDGSSPQSLGFDGTETFDVVGLDESLQPQSELVLRVTKDGESNDIPVLCRIDTPIEVDYYRHGGILPYVLRQLATA